MVGSPETRAALYCVFSAVGLATSASAHRSPESTVDLLIVDGTVVDGTGSARRRADVAIDHGLIVAVGPRLRVSARTSIDAKGEIVSPGFIDIHNHSDGQLLDPKFRLNPAAIEQGVTTIIAGPDGECSPSCIKDRTKRLGAQGTGTNFGYYVGHNGIRTEVMGDRQNRAPTTAELQRMRALVRKGMQLGAVGLSTGLMYKPGVYSKTPEVIALAREVRPFGGIYESHVRDPSHALLRSNEEAIAIGRAAGIPVDLTHLAAMGRYNRGLMRQVIALVNRARNGGVKVIADQYPYPAAATATLYGLLDYPEAVDLSNAASIKAALRSPSQRQAIRETTLAGTGIGPGVFQQVGNDAVKIVVCPGCHELEGKFLSELVGSRGRDEIDVAMNLILANDQNIGITLAGSYEEDLRRLMRQPWVLVGSDGRNPEFGSLFSNPHPRFTGTYPRVLGRYVRELGLLTLENAIRRMTSGPADFLGLTDRGRIKPGAKADIVIFNASQIADQSTWADPGLAPVGVRYVLVNGQAALAEGKLTGRAPGEFVRRQAPAIVR